MAEAGVILPPERFLAQAKRACRENNVLFILDEVQTGLGRTGKMFAWQHEGEEARPDGMMLGKALGGGSNIISALVLSKEALGLLEPGSEGSTFGGNPEACAVALKTLELIVELNLPERAAVLGGQFMDRLRSIQSPLIKEVRGRGLLIAVELAPEAGGARAVQEALLEEGVLAIKRHENVIGFSPPLNINEHNLLVYAVERIKRALKKIQKKTLRAAH
jgi:ornithine--oxo-acid transaminase